MLIASAFPTIGMLNDWRNGYIDSNYRGWRDLEAFHSFSNGDHLSSFLSRFPNAMRQPNLEKTANDSAYFIDQTPDDPTALAALKGQIQTPHVALVMFQNDRLVGHRHLTAAALRTEAASLRISAPSWHVRNLTILATAVMAGLFLGITLLRRRRKNQEFAG